ncbi:class II aldolase/adducin family protein [Thalassotalea ponticola]|uniref:class II aldolase/adducin family protein n=1 Tax=Thalassotalea ponticola TaxID=1523392 RepID=UPI0025B54FE9|nr:class II aldolase/adducin family protein [Thalassotalea ponticola]MDN3652024.1 class II aldolase/adducin family protein [Thalassotalea ponticola]
MDKLVERNLQNLVSEQEWQTRVDLAACYRLVAHMGWDDLIYTHISARIGDSKQFLINPFGVAFDEVTASNLVKIDIQGNILDGSELAINPAGFTIHSAIHEVRHDATCVIHLHTPATICVASQQQGLLPLSQYAMFSLASLSYHDYEGLAVNLDERKRLQDDLANTNHMLLPNHGALTLGPTIGDAFMRFYDLQRACEIQLAMQASGQPIVPVKQHIIDSVYKQANIVHSGQTGGQKAWPAMLRKAKRLFPDFAR